MLKFLYMSAEEKQLRLMREKANYPGLLIAQCI